MSDPIESFREQLNRVEMMAEDTGDTWDLSGNDQAALTALLASHANLLTALRELTRAWDSTTFPVSDRMEIALKDADAAIAKAEDRA